MTINSFFAGIGGFDFGFEKEGFNVKFQCELNDFCVNILNKHWPNIPLHKDIKTLNASNIPDAEIWCGGFPCQDVSVARGSKKRDGLKGKNSGLFYEFINLIGEKKPKVVLLENVTGLLNSHKGKDFKIILDSFMELGYGVAWRVLNTRYFGAPQSRPRVYICAWKNNLENAALVLNEIDKAIKPKNPRLDFLEIHKNDDLGVVVPKVAYCLAATSGRHTGTDWSRTYVSYYDKVRRLTPSECEKLQGFPSDWTLPTNLNDINKIDSLRYHAVGNAVSVPTIRWIAKRLKERLRTVDRLQTLEDVALLFNDFKHITPIAINSIQLTTDDEENYKWSTGGMAYDGKFVQNSVHSSPVKVKTSKLIDILDAENIDERYYISPTAARGILRRVNSQNRKLFEPLYDALERLANSMAIKNKNLSEHEILLD